MQQYFISGLPQHTVFQVADKDTAKHMFSVMRLQAGDEVVLVFDDGVKRLARVVDQHTQTVELLHELPDQVELPIAVTIALGFPKGDKLEFVAQKATELGISGFWAFPSDWSVVKWDGKKLAKKSEKLSKIVQGAAEQSKRNRIPDVQLFEKKELFLARLQEFDTIFVAYEETAKIGERGLLAQALKQLSGGERILFIFGAEGGISPKEIDVYRQAGAKLVGLGPRILRAETAPLYALSVISYQTECP